MMTSQKELILAVLMEELAHELAGPVRFLDVVLQDLKAGAEIDPEDVSIAIEEMDRLRALLAALRQIHLPELPTVPLELASIVEEAVVHCEKAQRQREIAIVRDIPRALVIAVNPSYAEQAMASLFRLALACTPNGGRVSVAAHQSAESIELEVMLPVLACELPRLTFPLSAPAFDLLFARRIASSYGHRLEQEQWGSGARLRLRMRAATATFNDFARTRGAPDAYTDC